MDFEQSARDRPIVWGSVGEEEDVVVHAEIPAEMKVDLPQTQIHRVRIESVSESDNIGGAVRPAAWNAEGRHCAGARFGV